MENRKCPMCQCEQFYQAVDLDHVPLGYWTSAMMHGLVCLNCGFIANGSGFFISNGSATTQTIYARIAQGAISTQPAGAFTDSVGIVVTF